MFHTSETKLTGKTVLVTGHTGFKGAWLCHWLLRAGCHVVGVSREVPTQPSIFSSSDVCQNIESHFLDLADTELFLDVFERASPDIVFHLAAQPLVLSAYDDPVDTMRSNILGTVSVLEALRKCERFCVGVLITSDKSYDNVEQIWGYRENDRLGGKDPYSASKGAAELVIRGYFESFLQKSDVRIAIARAGNVIGGGDWASNRIVVDCMRAWSNETNVCIRNPNATRPWQHVLEPLHGYMTLAERLLVSDDIDGEAFNFGPSENLIVPVSRLIQDLASTWNNKDCGIMLLREDGYHEATILKLDCEKARNILRWQSILSYNETINMTGSWYQSFFEETKTVDELIYNDISRFETVLGSLYNDES